MTALDDRPSETTTPFASNLEAALALAALGIPVHPLCGPTAEGECGCPAGRKRHEGKAIGKAPMTEHGVKDATTDPETIRKWWKQWPSANVSGQLNGPTRHLLVVDCDSTQAVAEVHRKGIPRTVTRQSANGPAYVFLATEDCPATTAIHTGESKTTDILSSGYTVFFGRHRSGTPIFTTPLELPTWEAPRWCVDTLKAEVTKRTARKAAAASLEDDDDGPPVELNGDELRRWHGELVDHRPDGSGTDRSQSLVAIARILRRHGFTKNGILLTLRKRDAALGWDKFTGRSDARERYGEIATLALTEPVLRVTPRPSSTAAADPADCCAELRTALDAARERIAILEQAISEDSAIQRLTLQMLGNPSLSKTDIVAYLHALVIADSERTRNEARQQLADHYREMGKDDVADHMAERPHVDDRGRVTIWRNELAERAGISVSTVTASLKRLNAHGLLVKETVSVPERIDKVTGVIHDRHLEIRVSLPEPTLVACLEKAVAFRADEPRKHGGARQPTCELHPHAGVLIATVTTCAEPSCGMELARSEPHYHAAAPIVASGDNRDEPPHGVTYLYVARGDNRTEDDEPEPINATCNNGTTPIPQAFQSAFADYPPPIEPEPDYGERF